MQKFFLKSEQINGDKARIIGNDINHIKNVLRCKIGEKIIICNEELGISYNSEITKIEENHIECILLDEIKETTESNVKISIYQGIPKFDKMELIIQKCTEIGAFEFIPVEMKRSIVKIKDNKKISRWQTISEVAAKQSKRDIIPIVKNPIKIKQLKEEIDNFDLFLICYEEEKNNTLKNELKKLKEKIEENENNKKNKEENNEYRIGVLIGPEGGIAPEEIEELKDTNSKIITLGKRILRTETAPINITSNIIYELE